MSYHEDQKHKIRPNQTQSKEPESSNYKQSARHIRRKQRPARNKLNGINFLLMGLNQCLDDVKGRFIAVKPLPSLKSIFSKVRHVESRKKIMDKLIIAEPEGTALAAKLEME